MKQIISNARLKPFVRKRDSYLCCFCRKDIREIPDGNKFGFNSVHHIIPRSLGGQNVPENCVSICADCHHLLEKFIFPIKNMVSNRPIVLRRLRRKWQEDLEKRGFVMIKKQYLDNIKKYGKIE